MSVNGILEKHSVTELKRSLSKQENKLEGTDLRHADQTVDMPQPFTVSGFEIHKCVDCGKHLSKFGAVRCPECNMRRVGKARRKTR
jgi:DNA-directed RNA polymerase subunit RPC12/RpoP